MATLEASEIIDQSYARNKQLQFDKARLLNAKLRLKYSDPLKFMDSELSLADTIKDLERIPPDLFTSLYVLGDLVGLLSHENTDIAACVVSLLNEYTEEDTESLDKHSINGLIHLVSELDSLDISSLIIGHLGRVEDTQSIFDTLSLTENIVSIMPLFSDKMAGLLDWLLDRMCRDGFDSVRQYATELCCILVQSSSSNRAHLGSLGGIDKLLRMLSHYRRADPASLDETEMLENAFDILCISLAESSNLDEFVRLEGLELMNLFVIERRRSKMKAFKVLDHALVTSATCTRYIEISGLSGLFTSFMLKGSKKYKKAYPDYSVKEEQEHIVSIIFSILKHVDDQDLIQRLLAKFVENEYEKLVRLLDIFDEYQKKTLEAEAQLAEASKGEKRDPDLVYLDRLDAGLFTLQLAALVLLDLAHVKQVFLLMQVRSQLEEQLAARNYDLETLTLIAQEYYQNLGSEENKNSEELEREKERLRRVMSV